MKTVCQLLATLFFCACSHNAIGLLDEKPGDNPQDYDTTPICLNDTQRSLAAESNNMTWRLLRESLQSGTNTLLSPLSLSACLAMLDNGAAGETEQQIREFLGFKDYSQHDFNLFYKTLLEGLPDVDESVCFTCANSLWHDLRLQPLPSFSDALTDYYDATVQSADFGDPNTVSLINAWCSDKTNGLISKLADRLPTETVSLLLNAIYFKGAWLDRFDEARTSPDTFHLSNGSDTQADFMHDTRNATGYDDATASIVCLPMGLYEQFDTFFILPKDGHSLDEAAAVAQDVFGNRAAKVRARWKTYNFVLSIPKFTIRTDMSLKQRLMEMGLQRPFAAADYTPMFGRADIELTDIKQLCYFSINEREVEAAAVTGGMCGVTSAPEPPKTVILNLNRPFLFSLYEQSSGTILFIGSIENPSTQEP